MDSEFTGLLQSAVRPDLNLITADRMSVPAPPSSFWKEENLQISAPGFPKLSVALHHLIDDLVFVPPRRENDFLTTWNVGISRQQFLRNIYDHFIWDVLGFLSGKLQAFLHVWQN